MIGLRSHSVPPLCGSCGCAALRTFGAARRSSARPAALGAAPCSLHFNFSHRVWKGARSAPRFARSRLPRPTGRGYWWAGGRSGLSSMTGLCLRHRRSPSRLAGGAPGPSLCAVSLSSTYGAGRLMGWWSLRALLDDWASPSPSSVAIASGRGCAGPLALRGLAFLDLRGGATDGLVVASGSPR